MSSIVDQIISAAVAALLNHTDAQDRVFRSRAEAITREEAPSIVVKPFEEETKRFGNDVDENRLIVSVDVLVRGDPTDALADPVLIVAHRLLMADPTLSGLVTRVRKISKAWESQEADQTAGCVVTKYEMTYLSAAGDLTVPV